MKNPADMSPAEFDEFVSEIRLPALRAARDEITRELVAIFQQIGFSVDPDWKQRDRELDVQNLLAGAAVPVAAEAMPLPALHWALIRKRETLDRAIDLGTKCAARAAQRVQDRSIAAARDEIEALDRRRTLLAVQLQAVNRQREELRLALLAHPQGRLFPTDGLDLLGLAHPVDDVAIAVERMTELRLLSRKEINDAGK